MKPVKVDAADRHMIYPGQDPRVRRILRKVIRGLRFHHGFTSPISDSQIEADVLRYVVPEEFLERMPVHHREREILEYRLMPLNLDDMESAWILTFFERRTFIGVVSNAAT
jgi:hypothetical protein